VRALRKGLISDHDATGGVDSIAEAAFDSGSDLRLTGHPSIESTPTLDNARLEYAAPTPVLLPCLYHEDSITVVTPLPISNLSYNPAIGTTAPIPLSSPRLYLVHPYPSLPGTQKVRQPVALRRDFKLLNQLVVIVRVSLWV
jgi:hypothetical protein